MFCCNCGTALPNGINVCPTCGTVHSINNQTPAHQSTPQPVVQQPVRPVQPVVQQPVISQPVVQQPVIPQPVVQQPVVVPVQTVVRQPLTTPAQISQQMLEYANSALRLGICSLVFSWIGLVGLILACVSKSRANFFKRQTGTVTPKVRTAAILSTIGLILSIIGLVFGIYIGFLIFVAIMAETF